MTAVSLQAQLPFGQWDFNSSNLTATVGLDLAYADGPGGATAAGTRFGTTASLGIPSLPGGEAVVMKYPASAEPMGFHLTAPPPNGRGTFVDNYTLVLDVLFPAESHGQVRPILETDGDLILPGAGADLVINTDNGLGVSGGSFDGQLASNTWYRIGFVVATNQLRTYINGSRVGTQIAQADRLVLSAGGIALFLGNIGVNPAAGGYVNSVQLRDEALSDDQMQALGGPTAEGIPQLIPTIPSYVQAWIPAGAASRTVTDIGAVINPGGTIVDPNNIVLRLNGVAQTNLQITSNGLITVRKPNVGPLTAGTTYTLQLNYTDNVAGAKSFTKQFKAAFLFEDFESLVLGDSVDEGVRPPTQGVRATNVWTKTPPPGWTIDDSQMPDVNDTNRVGIFEWHGWSVASRDWWVQTAGDQTRSQFTRGIGAVAIADPDEWDDVPGRVTFDPNGNPQYFNSFLTTPALNIAGAPVNSVFLKFDSSWRPEGFDDWGDVNNQTATITVQYDGGTPVEVLRWDSQDGGPFFKPDAQNETVFLLLGNPAGATSMVVTFGLTKGANDWWWAIDNVEINMGDIASSVLQLTPAPNATGVGPRPQLGAVIAPGTTTVDVNSIELQFDSVPVTVSIASNAQGHVIVSGRAPSVVPKLSSHTATLSYVDNLNGRQSTNWTFTVADYAEITLGTPVWMEEFNGVTEGSFPPGWVATNYTTAIRTNYDLADVNSAAYEGFVVIDSARPVINARRRNVSPTVLNGQAVDALMSGNFVYGESDRRSGSQVQILFSPSINLTGISNVMLVFNSIYEQNQDSLGAVEYSIDGGITWLPLLYMMDRLDIIAGDPVATLGTSRADQAWGEAYGAFIGATVDASFEPFISGRIDDDPVESKRIEVLPLPLAANQPDVRLRFTHTGTASWYFGIDDVGIYGDGGTAKAPMLVSQPQSALVKAGDAALLVAGVDPTATRPLSFQWTRNGTNVPGATAQTYAIAAMQPTDAGDYRLIVSNTSGSVTSQVATLTYLLPEPPGIAQNPADQTVTADLIARFSVTATGTPPLSYQWLFDGAPLADATAATLTLERIRENQAGGYSVVVSNNYGIVTSQVAVLTVLPAPPVQITGQWDFDCGTLQATVGHDLAPFDATVAADTQFGTTTSFGIADIGGSPARVLYFTPSVDRWGGYRMAHGAPPNGDGAYVNRFTLIYDVYYPTASHNKWRALLQTSTANANDGDLFVSAANGVGISGNYSGTILPETWHRIVTVFDLPYRTLKKYVDGALVGTQTLSQGTDGRWSLDSVALLFADEDGETAPAYVNSVQFRNGVLTDADVAALGGVTSAAGIPGAVPRICSVSRHGNTLTITWAGQAGVKLQKATSLTAPNWQDVPATLGASSATETMTGEGAYYRLTRQP